MKPEELSLEDIKNVCVIEDGQVLLCVGLTATLYLENTHLPEMREAMIACFEDYWSLVGTHMKWMGVPQYRQWQKVIDGELPSLRSWVPQLDPDSLWFVNCHGGVDIMDASHFTTEIFSRAKWENESKNSLSYFNVTFPMTWFTEHGGSFRELVIGWCKRLQPYHGYAGLGVISPLDTSASRKAESVVYGMGRRFPGLEIDYPVSHSRHLKDGIKGANWLTILADKWVDQLGGFEKLSSEVDEHLQLFKYPGGLLIQAGEKPQIGDVNRRYIPEHYQIASRLLKPVRIDYPFGMQHLPDGEGFDREHTKEWFSRFD